MQLFCFMLIVTCYSFYVIVLTIICLSLTSNPMLWNILFHFWKQAGHLSVPVLMVFQFCHLFCFVWKPKSSFFCCFVFSSLQVANTWTGEGAKAAGGALVLTLNCAQIKHLGLTEASRRPAPSPFGSSELVNRGSGNKQRSDFKISSHLHEAYLNGDDCHCHCNQEKYFWRHFSFPYSFYVWRERVIFKLISFGHWVCSSLATNLECFHSSLKRFSNGFYSVTRSLLNFSILPAGHSENLWSKFLSTGGEWGPVISSFDRSARNRSSSSSWFLFIRRTLF